jgi:CheY-like chemotaxis protein
LIDQAKGKRLLIIDDEQLLLDLLEHLLVRLGYQVDPVLDVREAFHKLEEQNYDAIFLDMKMPLMGGKEFYSEISEKFPVLSGRIVFVTGDLANPVTASFIEETGNFYLQKPFTLKEVMDLLERFFLSS